MRKTFFLLVTLLSVLEICKSQVYYSEVYGSCGYYVPIMVGEQQYNISISVRDYEEIFIPGVMCTECQTEPKFGGAIRYTRHKFEFTYPSTTIFASYSPLETMTIGDYPPLISQFMVLLNQSEFLTCETETQGKMGLIARKGTQVHNLFTKKASFSVQICSSEYEKIGNLWLGGYDASVASLFENVPATYEKFAQVKLNSIVVENNAVTIDDLDSAIVAVDPTHKFFTLSTQKNYQNFVQALRNSSAINWAEETTESEKDSFWGLVSDKSIGIPVRNSTINLDYTITLKFGDTNINLHTRNLVVFYNDGVDMMKIEGINFNQEGNLIIIGGSMLRNRVIIYNRQSSLIGFSDERSTCSGNGTVESLVELDSFASTVHMSHSFTFLTSFVLFISFVFF